MKRRLNCTIKMTSCPARGQCCVCIEDWVCSSFCYFLFRVCFAVISKTFINNEVTQLRLVYLVLQSGTFCFFLSLFCTFYISIELCRITIWCICYLRVKNFRTYFFYQSLLFDISVCLLYRSLKTDVPVQMSFLQLQ